MYVTSGHTILDGFGGWRVAEMRRKPVMSNSLRRDWRKLPNELNAGRGERVRGQPLFFFVFGMNELAGIWSSGRGREAGILGWKNDDQRESPGTQRQGRP